ncbi:CDP-paratose 2-epimerase [Candidatus Poribacteria bacterium]|nr:MAG: CDP-paratose 2-epimerase [Candidatus Poribacteria bacterium]
MKTFRFITHQTIEQPIAQVFAFFSDAHNLAEITPPWLRFEVLTPAPIAMQVGTRIDYRLRIRGIPISWQSEITAWVPPRYFMDEQRRGPYRLWRHTHTFEETAAGTVVGDEVEYAVWGSSVVNTLFVRRDIEKIFAYRAERLDALFHRKNNNPR